MPHPFLAPPRGFCGERKKRVGDNHSPIFTGPFFYLLPGPRGVGFQITRLPDFSMTQSVFLLSAMSRDDGDLGDS